MKPVEKIWINGEMVDWEKATMHVLSHVVHYGFGVFEGIRSYEQPDGTAAIFRLEDHIQRLLDSAHILRLECGWTFEDWIRACEQILKVNGLKGAYLRPAHMSGYGKLGLAAIDNPPVSIVAAFEWGAYLGEEGMRNGIRAKVSSFQRNHHNAHMLKGKVNGMYVNNILAKREAVDNGYDEAIMLDTGGYVAEASGENLFMIHKGKVHTAPLANVLGGITRDSCIRIMHDMGLEVVERLIARDELYISDEVFMCGTAAEVTPVREIDQREVGTGHPGPVTKEVQSRFLDAVHGKRPEYAEWLHPVA